MNAPILLARHASHAEVGHVLSGRSAIALSREGQAEAKALAARLADVPIASVHASPRSRARETAEAVGRSKQLEVRVAAELDEIDFGDFTGRAFAELERDPRWREWNCDRSSARCPGGETMAEAVGRATGYLMALSADELPALCVSHGDVIRGIVARQLGLGFDRIFSFDCDPASLTRLGLDGGGMRLMSLNEPVQ